ncbi:MAG: NAD-glutamate dehydrogenase domain-containing protein, partial [Candidatus Marinamargulisbacteria bacterium]
SEWVQLVSWLNDQNFSFFGAHVIDRNGQQSQVKTALGICHPDMNIPALVTPNDTLLGHPKATPFLVDHTRIPSPIQRFTPLMRISFKFNTTQYVFYGILKRSSMYAKNMDTPILRKKMAHIFNERQFLPGSYDYNDVIRIFNDIPKFELFRTHQRDLLTMVDFIMSITNLNHVQCFPLFASKTNLIFYFVIPYYLFTPRAITLITDYVKNIIPHTHCDTLPINAPEKCRIHMHFTLDAPPQLPDEDTLERSLTTLIQPWEDQVRASLIRDFPESLKNEPQIIDKIPSHYRVRTRPDAAIRDIRHLMSLTSNQDIRFEFMSFTYPPTSDLANKASLLLIYHQTKLDLTNILPILHHLGIHVIDQITSRFGDETDTLGYILAFRLLDTSLQKINESQVKDRLIHALESIFKHKLPNDPLNGLILSTKLNAETLFVLQGIRNYVYQVFSTLYSMASINQALLTHPSFSENLGQLFICKFDPTKTNDQRLSAIISLNNQLKNDIKSVQNISDDQILRRCLSVVTACVRSNYFFKAPTDALSFKFKCEDIFGIPTPIPYRETMVFDSEMEGVHIRFGAVARGGLRWSDRLDDYRTEVLGLVRTQQTKNAVIIPVGSKGGFVVKTPNPTPEMAQHQYKRFITAMLQLADNIIDNQPVINDQRIAYDDVDPYFVVAADKGTATFSDIANDVSISHNFWLGDGFASGGQYGYDHKKVGITAKGAWECTKLHFKTIGKNPEKDNVRVAGVGDMSGDVFGNGLLLSETIQLVAAFNHMHIFIDPNPDIS